MASRIVSEVMVAWEIVNNLVHFTATNHPPLGLEPHLQTKPDVETDVPEEIDHIT